MMQEVMVWNLICAICLTGKFGRISIIYTVLLQ